MAMQKLYGAFDAAITLTVALALLLLLAGCQSGTSADLKVYREGLHPLDAALYAEHLTLLNQAVAVDNAWRASESAPSDPNARLNLSTAVNAVRRSADPDLKAVQQQIDAAESLYRASRAHDAVGTPTTRPVSFP